MALFSSTPSATDPNVITLRIQPDEGITIAFDVKRPGNQMRALTIQANFSYRASFGSKGPAAYETLLLDSCVAMPRYLRAPTKWRQSGASSRR